MSFCRALKLFSLLASVALLLTMLSACTSPDKDEDDNGGGGGPVVDDDDLNGVTIKIEGKSYYLGNASVYRFSPANQRELDVSYAGTATFHGTKLNYASVFISNTLPLDSIQTCGVSNTNAAIKLEFGSTSDDWGGTYNATACQIKIEYMSQRGGMQGTIVSATFKNAENKTLEVTNAKFKVYRYTGYAGDAPEVTLTSDFLATLQIDSGSFELRNGQHFRLSKPLGVGGSFVVGTRTTDGNAQVDGNASDALSMAISGGSSGACGGSRAIQVSLGTYLSEMNYVSSGAGAACSLNVEGQGTATRGTYTATLIAADNILPLAKRRIKVHGSFRNYSLGVALPAANETLPADSLGMALNVGTNGSWHFPANGKYRLAASGVPTKHGTTNFSFSFQRGRDTRSDLSVVLRYIPAKTGTFTCGTPVQGAPAGYVTTILGTFADTAWAGINYDARAEIPSSSCSITVTNYSASRIEGTYTANLVAYGAKNLLPDGDTTLTVSGSFRSTGLP